MDAEHPTRGPARLGDSHLMRSVRLLLLSNTGLMEGMCGCLRRVQPPSGLNPRLRQAVRLAVRHTTHEEVGKALMRDAWRT